MPTMMDYNTTQMGGQNLPSPSPITTTTRVAEPEAVTETKECATQTSSPRLEELQTNRTITVTPSEKKEVPASPPKETRAQVRHAMPKNVPFPKHCITHKPTLEELQSQSFSEYVRNVVLAEAHPYDLTKDEEVIDFSEEIMELSQGITKVSLPDGFWNEDSIQKDRTGRGPAWKKGTKIGNFEISTPIKQNINGLAGVYEYTFTVEKPLTIAEFREKADAYRKQQIGEEFSETFTEEEMIKLETKFWKRLGPTMVPAMYGADQEGTLFGDDDASGWSLAELDSCLHVLPKVPGVTSPYIYAGMWASVFAAHTEDVNLLSINYLHAGAPKVWYAIAPGPDAKRFEALAQHEYSVQFRDCKEFLRHKRCLVSPKVLQKAGIKYQTAIQMPGEAVITFPGGYHFGFNTGFNIAEATNFGVPEWIPYGRKAKICMCRPDSVRIDIDKLVSVLGVYDEAKKKEPSLSWLQWYRRREEAKAKRLKKEKKMIEEIKKLSSKKKSDQQKKNEFWIEVMTPTSKETEDVSVQSTASDTEDEEEEELAPIEPVPPQIIDDRPGKRARKLKRHFDELQEVTARKERALYGKKNRKKKKNDTKKQELWHLARIIGKKKLNAGDRVLCLVPGIEYEGGKSRKAVDFDEEEEHCFRASIVEIEDGYALCTFDELPKSEDAWLPLTGNKVFLDGGQWTDTNDAEGIPHRHFWAEFDSRHIDA